MHRISSSPSLLILVLGFTLSLSSCGFRLAGTADLPKQLASIYLSDNGFNESQRRDLQRRLTQAGAALVGSTDAGAAKLSVSLKSLPDRRMATSASTGAIVTRITRQLDFSVKSADGITLVPMRSLT